MTEKTKTINVIPIIPRLFPQVPFLDDNHAVLHHFLTKIGYLELRTMSFANETQPLSPQNCQLQQHQYQPELVRLGF